VIRELPSKKVISYALAYINPAIYGGDNGRVLGYDNSHGYSHRHFMGSMTAEEFPGYEVLYGNLKLSGERLPSSLSMESSHEQDENFYRRLQE
jgi:hypothetical protein